MVDYADKMTADIKDRSSYKIMEYVYEHLRIFVHENQKWGWTASQASRADKYQKKHVDLEHVADSINKVRVADLVVTLNLDEEDEMKFYVAKNRTGRSRQTVGPLPTEFEIGCIVPLSPTSPTELLAGETEKALGQRTFLDDL